MPKPSKKKPSKKTKAKKAKSTKAKKAFITVGDIQVIATAKRAMNYEDNWGKVSETGNGRTES